MTTPDVEVDLENVFGELDVDEIPDNPFWVKAGDYSGVVSDAFYKASKKDADQQQLVIEYIIAEPDSEFDNKTLREYFNVYPGLTKEYFNSLPGSEKAAINSDLTRLKQRLYGQPDWNPPRPGLGIVKGTKFQLSDIKGIEVDLVITNWGDNDQGVNIRSANIKDHNYGDVLPYSGDTDN